LVEQGTLNPKVEGSNPSRPIQKSLQIGIFAEAAIGKGGSEATIPELTLTSSREKARTSAREIEPEGESPSHG
jgi:hypothetical protein